MRVTALKDEATIAEVADRLYSNLTPESRKIASAALLRANPHLSRADLLRPGAVLAVPHVPKLKLRPGQTRSPLDDARAFLGEAIGSYGERLKGLLEAEERHLEGQTATLKEAAKVIKATEGAPEIAERLTASLRKRRESIQDERGRQEKLLARIAKDLEALF